MFPSSQSHPSHVEGSRLFTSLGISHRYTVRQVFGCLAPAKQSSDPSCFLAKSARAHLDLGVFVYFVGQNYKAAADEYETALNVDPAYMPSYFRAGQITVFYGDPARGEELLRKYLTYSPKDNEPSLARAHYWLGRIFEKQGKKAERKASYTTSLKLNPNQKDVAEALKRVP